MIKQMLAPLQRRWRERPLHRIRQEHLQTALREWMTKLPSFGRPELKHDLAKHSLAIAECRLMSGDMNFDIRQTEDYEPSVAVAIITLHVNEEEFSVRYRCMAMFSQHALARRMQRSANNNVDAIFKDVACVVAHCPRLFATKASEFTCPCAMRASSG